MIGSTRFSIEEYHFDEKLHSEILDNRFAREQWPVVYILSDGKAKQAYVGETTDAFSRMQAHLAHTIKQKLTAVHLISSDRFNKSATLDIESNLIKYMSADQQYRLLNANLGIANHNYYNKNEYWSLFTRVWDELQQRGLAKKSLSYIENLNLFKYSPYKSLSAEQNEGLLNILRSLVDDTHRHTLVEGGAGTGKSILAIFLFKLLCTSMESLNFQEFGENEAEVVELVRQIKNNRPGLEMALVVPMSSFRQTLQRVFKGIDGLSDKMVIGPSQVADRRYDLILVDEAHRLRQRVNLGAYYGSFDKASEKLGLDKMKNTELDWILQQADKAVFFYDANQSIKPSDVAKADFDRLIASPLTRKQQLKSQFRVLGGNDYVDFVEQLLNNRLDPAGQLFRYKKYDCRLFTSLPAMVERVRTRNEEDGLSRLVAGFAWPWVSNPKKKSKPGWQPYDIVEDGIELRWNTNDKDWINTAGCENEVGCIHTTQGYDLNYTGIIFGHEIGYDPVAGEIVIRKENYFDKNGKNTIKDPQRLKNYIVNIYQTIMLRGIKGTYVYACDPDLRDYLAQFIPLDDTATSDREVIRPLPVDQVQPYVNSVPLYHLTAAAGSFGEVQAVEDCDWIPLPPGIKPSEDLFACRVIGQSMNRVIPDSAICLFRKYHGGSRGGKILLVELSEFTDQDAGSAYTVKEYWSRKVVTEEGYAHREILLKPRSDEAGYSDIVVTPAMTAGMRVVGEFLRGLTGKTASINK